MIDRMVRAGRLDLEVYQETEHNPAVTTQAVLVVLISSVSAGIGSFGQGGLLSPILGTLAALVGWLIWFLITYALGVTLSRTAATHVSYRRLLRAAGFSASPGVIRILGAIPFLFAFIWLVALIWMFAAMVIASRQVLDFSGTWRAVGVVAIGWIIQVVFLVLFFMLVI